MRTDQQSDGRGARMPTWQTVPCAPWCVIAHGEADEPDDRVCMSDPRIVPTQRPPIRVVSQKGIVDAPHDLEVSLEADHPGAPARLVLRVSDFEYVPMSPDQARQLATALNEAAETASSST